MAKPFKLLRKKMSPEAQARSHEKAEQMLTEMPLQELRKTCELSQQTKARADERPSLKQLLLSEQGKTDLLIPKRGMGRWRCALPKNTNDRS